jgi:glycosyltransferase involved in cell wall biosynthesis
VPVAISETSPPVVSLIVRTIAGRGGFLRDALLSIAAQTLENIEVIVVEDGGETARQVVAATVAVTGLAVTYLPLSKGGRCVAGNAGLAAARGRYCGFLDDDDQLLPGHLAALVPILEQQPAVPAVYGLAELRTTTLHSLEPLAYTHAPGRLVTPASVPFWPTLLTRNILPIQAVLFRRTLFECFGGFNPALDHFEDWDLWLRYAQAGLFVCVPDVTSFYRLFTGRDSARHRFLTAERYLPLLHAASAGYRWPMALADLRATHGQVMNRDVLRERIWRWIYRSAARARGYEILKALIFSFSSSRAPRKTSDK